MKQARSHRDRGPSQRQLRVGELIRHTLADLLERGEIHDPELAGIVVTVTEVRPSPDLRSAMVYVMPLGGGHEAETLEALSRAAPYLRRRVAAAVDLRFAPQLRFALDTTFDSAARIERLLHSPEVARDLAPEPGAAKAAKKRAKRNRDDGA
jgi:ribosome-binding factor A